VKTGVVIAFVCARLYYLREGGGEFAEYRQANKRVQSDAASRSGIGAKIGYVTRLDLRPISEKSRRG
jgi:hypothetical protein